MSNLANYSVETDHVVLLSFKDGRSLRVPFKHLSRYLKGADLDKVKKTINLRRHFLKIHMPRFFAVLAVAGGLLALLTLGGKTVASLLGHKQPPQPAPTHTGIARSRLEPTPVLSPSVQQPARRDIRLAAVKHPAARPNVASIMSAPTPAPVPPPSTPVPTASPVPSPTPSATPMPTPSASPSPSASPKPQVPGASGSPATP